MYAIIMLLLCICSYSYTAEQSFDYNTAPLDKPSEYYQKIGSDSLDNSEHFSQYTSTAYPKSRPPRLKHHQCPHCSQQIKGYPINLTQHIAIRHTICNFCNPEQPFPDRDTLYIHLENVHDASSWIQVLQREKRTLLIHHHNQKLDSDTSEDYDNEQQSSNIVATSDTNLSICPICSKRICGPKKNFHLHIAIAHYRCSRCSYEKEYTDKDTFIAHLSEHRDTNTIINYLLAHNKKFPSIAPRPNRRNILKPLMLTCPVTPCHVLIKEKTKLNIHIATKHIRCPLCNQIPKLTYISELYYHLLSTHKDQTYYKSLITYLSQQKYIFNHKAQKSHANVLADQEQEALSNASYDSNNEQSLSSYTLDTLDNDQSMTLPFDPSLFDETISNEY